LRGLFDEGKIFSNLSLLFSIVLIMSACATTTIQSQDNELRKIFDRYISIGKNAPMVERSKYFSKDLWSAWQPGPDNKDSGFYDPLAEFSNEVATLKGSMEKIEDESGCLIIEGLNSDNSEVDYQIDFTKQKVTWVIDYVGLVYYGNGLERPLKNDFCAELRREKIHVRQLDSAQSDEQREKLWLQQIQAQ
jgi:hypothetical protein